MLPIVCIGGGAAGFFAAIWAAYRNPEKKVILLEKSKALLSKVLISGGGRCNVTHNCFEPKLLIKNYPRGSKALLGPFYTFQPKDTIQWFESRGVELKAEEDGRIFPVTDSSQTIIDCLMKAAQEYGVDIRLKQNVKAVTKEEDAFIIQFSTDETLKASSLLLATGSSSDGFSIADSLGHSITPLVPSLFTFNVPNSPLSHLSGISLDPVRVQIEGGSFVQEGPLLITHFGFSGPAILKLSAFEARFLHEKNYEANLIINWLPMLSRQELIDRLIYMRNNDLPYSTVNPLTKSLWTSLTSDKKTQGLSNKEIHALAEKLQRDIYQIKGKTTNKQEFVTCGGVNLDEVDFKTMQSKKCKGLFFAGEILDIDGVTGGFNFQNAWSTSYIAAMNM
jgi:predicted Rossmann fold flavoprotein